MNTQEIIAKARARGSTATTVKGAARWLIKNRERVSPIPFPECYPVKTTLRLKQLHRTFTQTDRDLRRAKKDVIFRSVLYRRLHAELKEMKKITYTIAGIAAYANRFESIWDRCLDINAIYRAIGYKKMITFPEHPKHHERIVLVYLDEKVARAAGAKLKMMGKNCTLQPCCADSYGIHKPGETTWKNGHQAKYDRAIHRNFVRSFAILSETPSSTILYALHDRDMSITMPDGYTWARDNYGLKIVHGADDYHPTAQDLVDAHKHGPHLLVGILNENAARRKEMLARQAAEAAEMDGVYVCVADSVIGGNCYQGTIGFAAQNKLDPQRHYTPKELLELGNDAYGRLRIAIKAACIRHRAEMEAGVCVIADHRFDLK